jgi:hypothetical protein
VSFLQPWMLWGLAAASLPVLIHLLNRLRYRRIAWAAIQFLIQATRSSTRNARLRHYLILACRTLAIAAFLLLLARPIAGGWLGASLAGAPDMVLVLLDRSASMETADPRVQKSRREQALALLAGVPRERFASTRFMLLDSATATPQAIAGPAALPALALAAATDTAADLPALVRAAADAIARDRPGRVELWIASDLQASNWRPDSREWRDLAATLAALPQDVRVRVLSLAAPARGNRSVTLREARRIRSGGAARVELVVDVAQDPSAGPAKVPLMVHVNGARTPVEAALDGAVLTITRSLEWPAGVDVLWGGVELPADENPRDNACQFALGAPGALHAAIVADDAACGDRLRVAAAPLPDQGPTAETIEPGALAGALAREPALVVWQGAVPDGAQAAAVGEFARRGGVVLLLPPASASASATASPLGFAWTDVEAAPAGAAFRVAVWEEMEGPLSRTLDGRSLPVAALEVRRRAGFAPSGADLPDGGWVPMATFVDGRPLLVRRRLGEGRLYALSTLATDEWSSLGDGWILVPLVQRLMEEGGRRLGGGVTATCGVWRPAGAEERWEPVPGGGGSDASVAAGVYRNGPRVVALNRPAAEDDPEVVEEGRVRSLFAPLRVDVVSDLASSASAPAVQSELWPVLLILAMLFLLVEGALLVTEHAPRPAAKRGEVPS